MPLALLYIYISIYYIRPAEWVPNMQYHFQMYAGIVALLAIIYIFFTDSNKFIRDKLSVYLFYFLIICILSKLATGWFGGTWIFFLKFLPSIIVYYLIFISCSNLQKCKLTILVITLLTCFLCLHAIIQMNNGVGFGELPPKPRRGFGSQAIWYGVFHDPNDLGLAIVILAPYALYRLLKFNIFYFVAFILMLAGVFYTNSRGTIVALISGLSMYIILYKKSIKGLFIAGIFGVALLVFGPSRVSEINVTEVSAIGRIEAWYKGMELFISHPFLGVGPDEFGEYYFIVAHNSFIQALAETGLLGLMFYIGVIFAPIFIGIKILFQNRGQEHIKEFHGFIASLVSGAIAGAVSTFFISRTYTMIPYMMSGIINVALYSTYPELYMKEIEKISLKKLFLLSLTLVFSFYLLFIVIL